MVVRALGTEDPEGLVRMRLERVSSGAEAKLVIQQREQVLRDLALEVHTPLGLARHLAWSSPTTDVKPSKQGFAAKSVDGMTGIEPLLAPNPVEAMQRTVPSLLDVAAALRLVPVEDDDS